MRELGDILTAFEGLAPGETGVLASLHGPAGLLRNRKGPFHETDAVAP